MWILINKFAIEKEVNDLKKQFKSKRFCIWVGKRKVATFRIVVTKPQWDTIDEIEWKWIEELKAYTKILEDKWFLIKKLDINLL